METKANVKAVRPRGRPPKEASDDTPKEVQVQDAHGEVKNVIIAKKPTEDLRCFYCRNDSCRSCLQPKENEESKNLPANLRTFTCCCGKKIRIV